MNIIRLQESQFWDKITLDNKKILKYSETSLHPCDYGPNLMDHGLVNFARQ